MNWLALLKKSECAPETDTTKPTKPGFVGFVGCIPEPFQKSGADPASNDGEPWRVTLAPGTTPATAQRLRAASMALDKVQEATPATNDEWWPYATAMTGPEIDTLTARLGRFVDRGLSLDDSERLADRLAVRDREGDDRRVCLECQHLRGRWRCGNWQAAGVATNAMGAQLPGDFTTMLQRCDGHQSVINSPIQSIS